MKSYESSATIDAGADAIWRILTDAPAYATWDSGVEKVEGTIAPGETIKVYSQANPGRAFPVKVTEYEPGERMTWSGGMPLGLFKACARSRSPRRRAGRRAFTCARSTAAHCCR
jgi:Polyketide cyclase / dehydrase and lipid transport